MHITLANCLPFFKMGGEDPIKEPIVLGRRRKWFEAMPVRTQEMGHGQRIEAVVFRG